MLCPRCYGKHVVLLSGSWMPCPECAGIGELHCCDGLLEQGECQYISPPANALMGVSPLPPHESAPESGTLSPVLV